MPVLVLREQEIRGLVELDQEVVGAIEEGFALLASGQVTTPPILRLEVAEHNGEADVKAAYARGLEAFAIKVSTGFFDNPRRGLPSGSGLMLLFDAESGFPQAVLLENGYLTHVRTAAAGAVAAKYLAPSRVETAGLIGTGLQARWQLRALTLVRGLARVLVYGRSPEAAVRYAKEMAEELGVPIYPAETPAEVVRESQVVITATPARTPLVAGEWLHPGLHITAMGADAEDKRELAGGVLAKADRVVCDLKAQCLRLGELHHAVAEGAIKVDDPRIVELGEVVLGRSPGRCSEAEITVCDLTGTGIQDTLIARLAYQRARTRGLGLEV
ncbi:ectoine utilization protein EutC [Thermus oshimai]